MKYGYRPERMESLRFLTERMANNPRPFYGHPGATWVRMISAPGNVTSRVADLVAERNTVFGEPLDLATHLGAYNYLKLYYQGRRELPEDESNGNKPLVSQYEVVYYSWRVFDREHKRTDSAESKQLADLTAKLLEQDRHKNLIDLCWHTIAMAEIDRKRTRSSSGWWRFCDSSRTRRLNCSQENSRLTKRSGLPAAISAATVSAAANSACKGLSSFMAAKFPGCRPHRRGSVSPDRRV